MATMNLHMPAGATGIVAPVTSALPSLDTVLSRLRTAFVVRVDAVPAQLDLAFEQSRMAGQAKARFWI